MSFIGKLITSLVVAAIASAVIALVQGGTLPDFVVWGIVALANLGTALLVTMNKPASVTANSRPARPQAAAPHSATGAGNADREQGQVKWFNVSKGFGFITMDNGEEIFVHFRSIRGEGRRSLKDGERVSFTVADSDKGPQAEDVEPLG